MKPSPVQQRGGHTAFPNELLARALGELTAEQFRLLVGLFYEAEFKREGGTAGPWRVGFGQVLVSYDGLAERYELSPDAIRRALRRFSMLGITSRRAEAATTAATEAATPPATSPATPPATPAAPIQHRNTGTPNTEKREPAAAQPRPAPVAQAKGGDEETAAARVLRELAEHVFLELRGEPYTLATKQAVIADRVAARNLLVAASGDLSAIEARWRQALVNDGFPRVDTLADLAKHWARFSPPPAVARRRLAETSKRAASAVELDSGWLRSLDPALRQEAVSAWEACREDIAGRSWWTAADETRALEGARAQFIAAFSKRAAAVAGAA